MNRSSHAALSRRAALAGAGAACLSPAVATASPIGASQPESSLAALWREVKALDAALQPHAEAIAAAAAQGGVPGWMRLDGEINRLGEERYRRLVSIINGAAGSDADLAIKAQAALHDDIRAGAFTWAGETLALSVLARLGQAVA
jgi:hypothetical protein